MNLSSFVRSACLICVTLLFLQACGGEDPFSIDYSKAPPPFDKSEAVRDFTLKGGLHIYILEEGHSDFKEGVTFKDRIVVKYTGRTEGGKIFASSYGRRSDNDTRFKTMLGNLTPNPKRSPATGRRINPLIEGFRKGLYGMKPGEKRIIVVPPEMGSRQYKNGTDLEGKTLIYNVVLVAISGVPN